MEYSEYVEVTIDGHRVLVPKNRGLHITSTGAQQQGGYVQPEYSSTQISFVLHPERIDPNLKNWPRRALGADKAVSALSGAGINIALFDSGVSPHGELNGKVDVLDMTGANNPGDTYGHGTAIAGIIVGNGNGPEGFKSVAPGARIKSYKITYEEKNREGVPEVKTNNIHMEQAILNVLEYNKYRADNRIDIINISYGLSDQNKLLEDALARAYNSGITIIAAAGNNAGEVVYPAAYNFIISAGAITPQMQINPVSASGKNLDFMAPGQYIFAPRLGGGYGWIDGGTSYSAAYITGVAALIMEAYQNKHRKKPTPQEVYVILQKISSKLPGVSDARQGMGLPDASKIAAVI
jgi:subtilisin family serine protease